MLTIRSAMREDAAAIAGLLGQLGYSTLPDAIPARLTSIADEGGVALVAVDDAHRVVGVATAARHATLHAGEQVGYITALVTDQAVRRLGVGRALVQRLESWAVANGCQRLSVTSAEHRADAHAFYPRCGFPYTGRRFTKSLSPPS